MQNFLNLSPVIQALLAGSVAWLSTTLGAGLVFFFKDIKRSLLDTILGFAAGVMVAASCFGLLIPAFNFSEELGQHLWLMPLFGFLIGAAALRLLDIVLPHLHPSLKNNYQQEGPKSKLKRSFLMVIALTLHNIPEGLAIGVIIGAAGSALALGFDANATLAGALSLTLAITIQNLPEGFAVAVPLRKEGLSRRKAFALGSASGIVEPIMAVIGALLVVTMQNLLPFALAFAAGAMIYVVVEEIIPEMHSGQHGHFATFGFIIGFALIMLLDVIL
ncbi:MAG: ZIP family metal transporter [Spirochaetaceae bacterium]|nr:ZIP family metal transporter [Spirochaetaceae bacterium]